jgi:hypothetical protein
MGWSEGRQIQNCEFGVYALNRPLIQWNSKNIMFYGVVCSEVTLRYQGTPNMLLQMGSLIFLEFLHTIDPS